MFVVRYYGAKPDSHDYRDCKKQYRQIPSVHHSLVDLRQYLDHVYTQGKLHSCTANALCSALRLDLKKQGYEDLDPSRLFLYYNAREREGATFCDAGASIRDALKALNRAGVCEEPSWPYVTTKFSEKPPKRCYEATARGHTLCKYERLSQDIDQFRACLLEGCPFVFGFKVYNSFHSACNQDFGEMPLPSFEEKLFNPVGMLTVIAVGYDDQRRRVIVANSWGSGWGDKGYFYMPYDFISNYKMCFDFWKISFVYETESPRPGDGLICPSGNGSGGGVASNHSSCGGYCAGVCGRKSGCSGDSA